METTPRRETETKRFGLHGLDCAQCAANIETALRKIDGLEGAVVSYATESMSVPASHLQIATEVLARVEPDVQIVTSDSEIAEDEHRVPMERVVMTVNNHGNTSAASIPLAMSVAVQDNRIKQDDIVVTGAIGGGLAWGTAVIRW